MVCVVCLLPTLISSSPFDTLFFDLSLPLFAFPPNPPDYMFQPSQSLQCVCIDVYLYLLFMVKVV